MSKFYNECDIELDHAVNSLKEDMKSILKLADKCDKEDDSTYNTDNLRKCVNRFMEDC